MPASRHPCGTSLATLALAACTFAALATAAPPNASAASAVGNAAGSAAGDATITNPAGLVDPMVGTGSGNSIVGQVDTFPGADLPFGMIQWSPDTPSRPPGGGYSYRDHDITGFSLTHLSGPGCPIAGDIPVLPLAGALPSDPDSAQAPFTHSRESAHPGSYAVTAGGIRTQLAVTDRTGVANFTYPENQQAQLLVKVASSANGSSAAMFAAIGDDEISGQVTSGHFCGQPDGYTVYFAARFSRPFTASGTWGGTTPAQVTSHRNATRISVRGRQLPAPKSYGGAQAQGSGVVAGGWLTFGTTKDRSVGMQVAISYVSTAGALANLGAGAHTWNVAAVAAQATRDWNAQLGRISVSTASRQAAATFYTALYHASLEPSLFSDADGSYIGFDQQIHHTATAQYANFSGWDIYRSQVPLIAMLDPGIAASMATSLLNDAAQGGSLPKWPVANGYTGVMNGDSADPILADIYAFGGARAGHAGFDASRALADMVSGADGGTPAGQGWYAERPNAAAYISRGYVPNVASDSISPVPNGASETLEYAEDDFAISRLAAAIGQHTTARAFAGRSQNWANIFDTAVGYIEPRDAQGAFPSGQPVQAGAGFGQNGFQEGNAAQYTWMVPQNLRALAEGLGGDKAAIARLNQLFTRLNAGPSQPYEWAGNEPSLDTPWAYDSLGEPWRTQAVVRAITSKLYSLTPGGEPGNDDLGAMSSWYVWAELGLYPQTPGVSMFVLGAPRFPHASIHAPFGIISVNARNAGDPYIQGLRINGRPGSKAWVSVPGARELDFCLSAKPNASWASAPADAPPSFGSGPVRFPPSTRAALALSQGQIRLSPGSAATVSVEADNRLGRTAASVSWAAAGQPGLAVTPARGVLRAGAGAVAKTTVTIGASAHLGVGYYQVTFTARAGDGAVLPRKSLLVTVARPGQSIPTAYVSNFSDNTLTPVDTATRTSGPPVAVGAGPDGMVVTGHLLFVANNNSNNVTVIDTTTNAVVKTIAVGAIAADVAATPDGKTVWVSNFGSGTVQPIAVSTLTAGTPVAVGTQPERVAISPDGSSLWVANQGSGTVSQVDLATGALTRTIAVGAAPFGVAVTPDSSTVYATNGGSSSVSVIDTATGQVTATIGTGAGPQYVRFSPDGTLAYVADSGAGGVTVISVPRAAAGQFIATGAGAYAVAFSPDGTTAWVVDTNANNIVPVTVASGTAGAAVPTGNVPDGVTVTG